VLPLAGRAISFERLVGSMLIREDEPFTRTPPPPPPSTRDGLRSHPRASHLRLVTSRGRAGRSNDPLQLETGDPLKNLLGSAFAAYGRKTARC
jgi:hypothetical protein